MSSKPDRATKANDAIRSFTSKTEDFIGDILRDASARGFCQACAMNFVARLIVASCAVVAHEDGASTDEMQPTAFDDKPGHA
jgi:hypothetical protein